MESALDLFLKEYGRLTEIQELAMPEIRRRSNCLIIAPTGSGKTEAAVLPLLDRVASEGIQGIAVLYITPLRALNRDMFKRLEALCRGMGLTVGVRHGDTKQSERVRQSKRAPQVLITTPETLQSILPTKSFEGALRNVSAVVVDEINELYSSKRGAQLSVALERLERSSSGFQRIGISATIGDPETIGRFLSPNAECKIISLKKSKPLNIEIKMPVGHSGLPATAVEKFNLDAEAAARLGAIVDAIRKSKSTLVFANTRQVVEAIGSKLLYIDGIAPFGGIGVHHGSLNKEERVDLEDRFKDGKVKSVIATSSLELGIDIGNVDLVVQYGSPRQSVRLVQRVGRSGHSVSRATNGIVIVASVADAMESLALYDNALAGRLEVSGTHDNALDVLMHQVCGILLDTGGGSIDSVYATMRRAYIYRSLAMEEFMEVLRFMQEQRLARLGGARIEPAPQTRMFYYGHVSFIPDTKRFMVRDFNTNRVIGGLDERFVSGSVEEGGVFITKGLPWRVISIDEDTITVEPSSDFEAAVPDWSGEDIPVSRDTAEAVFGLFSNPGRVSSSEAVNATAKHAIAELIAEQDRHFRLGTDQLVLEDTGQYKILYSPLGSLANDALGKIVAYFLTSRLGRSVTVRSSPYLILFEVDEKVDILEYIRSIDPKEVAELLESSVQRSDVFYYRFLTTAKFFGMIDRESTVQKQMIKKMVKVLAQSPIYRETLRELTQNYFDVRSLSDLLAGLRSGRIRATTVAADSVCPFGDMILNSLYYTRELVMPVSPSSVVVDSFADYALKKAMKFMCTYCGFRFSRKLSDIKNMERLVCPDCGSVMLARHTEERERTIRRRLEGKRPSKRDTASLKEMLAEASLFSSYGGRAAIALSTYGVGAKTAARILMMLRRNSREFFFDLMEAQKQFIRTKKYWSA